MRVVSATNRNLAELVARGEFREDLLYRINLIAVHLPPLRERRDDIPLLAARFLQTVAQVYRREASGSAPAALRVAAGAALAGQRPAAEAVRRARGARDATRPCSTPTTSRRPPTWSRATRARDALPPVGSMTMDEIEKAMIVKSLQAPRRQHQRSPSRSA